MSAEPMFNPEGDLYSLIKQRAMQARDDLWYDKAYALMRWMGGDAEGIEEELDGGQLAS